MHGWKRSYLRVEIVRFLMSIFFFEAVHVKSLATDFSVLFLGRRITAMDYRHS